MENDLKKLALLAKQRMRSGNYSDAEKNVVSYRASDYFYQNAMILKRGKIKAEFVTIELSDEKFERKVMNMISSNDLLCNPIGKLVDKAYFNTLDDVQKQSYILSLSEKYNRIKEKYDLQCQKIG